MAATIALTCNKDEGDEKLIAAKDHLETPVKKRNRQKLCELARPQPRSERHGNKDAYALRYSIFFKAPTYMPTGIGIKTYGPLDRGFLHSLLYGTAAGAVNTAPGPGTQRTAP